jgi:transcription initiation factor TFIIIB Brf1 subunit/transcription initiation factor TFIIB
MVEIVRFHCLECGGNLIQTESDIVCMNCGLVANKIYEKPTIQLIKAEGSFGSQYASISERPSAMKSLGTYVGTYRKKFLADAKGAQLKIPVKQQFRRLKSLNDIYLHFNGRQREYRGYNFLTAICSTLQITDAAKADALFLYRSVHSHLHGELKLSSLIMGSLYLSIRSRKENIELARLVAAAQSRGYLILGKDIIKAASLIRQHVRIRISHVKSEEYLDNIISRLHKDRVINKHLQKKIIVERNEYFHCLKLGARKLLMNFPQSDRGGRNPFILAAAMIIASDIMIARQFMFHHCYKHKSRRGILTQKHIARILSIAEFTLREHYLLLAKPLMETELHSNQS